MALAAAPFGDIDQALPNLNEQLITRRVTERVIHVFEAVEIVEGDRSWFVATVACQQPFQFPLQRKAVGEAGQLIIVRKALQLLLGLEAVRDVFMYPRDTPHGAVGVVQWSGSALDIDQGAILAHPL